MSTLQAEMQRVLARVTEETLVLADADVRLPELPCTIQRFPFRNATGPKNAALAAVARWLDMTAALPMGALWAALEARFPKEAENTRASLGKVL